MLKLVFFAKNAGKAVSIQACVVWLSSRIDWNHFDLYKCPLTKHLCTGKLDLKR